MTKTNNALPDGVLASDTQHPKNYQDRFFDAGDHGTLTFYLVKGRSGEPFWVLTTLGISRSSNGRSDRTYGARLPDGAPVRVGKGPHVLKEVKVYITKARAPKLQKYIDLYQSGMSDAGMIRDRISSRRAEGALRRARGERSWMWSN